MAILGNAALLEVEINAGLEVFKVLEPEVQKGLIGLFHLFHSKQNEVKAAQAALNPLVGEMVAKSDGSSTIPNPDAPLTS